MKKINVLVTVSSPSSSLSSSSPTLSCSFRGSSDESSSFCPHALANYVHTCGLRSPTTIFYIFPSNSISPPVLTFWHSSSPLLHTLPHTTFFTFYFASRHNVIGVSYATDFAFSFTPSLHLFICISAHLLEDQHRHTSPLPDTSTGPTSFQPFEFTLTLPPLFAVIFLIHQVFKRLLPCWCHTSGGYQDFCIFVLHHLSCCTSLTSPSSASSSSSSPSPSPFPSPPGLFMLLLSYIATYHQWAQAPNDISYGYHFKPVWAFSLVFQNLDNGGASINPWAGSIYPSLTSGDTLLIIIYFTPQVSLLLSSDTLFPSTTHLVTSFVETTAALILSPSTPS